MRVINKIDIFSVAKLSGVIVGGLYLALGLVVNIANLVFGLAFLNSLDPLGWGSSLLVTVLIAVVSGAIAFLLGAICAWFYNVGARLVGGVVWQEETWVKKEPVINNVEPTLPPSMNFTPPPPPPQEPPRDTFYT